MLEAYFQNISVGMTKTAYFEMCEMLGSEPIEEEIPPDIEDFPIETQQAIELYHRLKDTWEPMGGVYLGKSYAGLSDLFEVYDVQKECKSYFLEWISVLDFARRKAIEANKPKK